MDPDSVPWTAFWVPDGLFEWLVMPFGLKNAPTIFQHKMDNCFRGTEKFIAVYIDDILVFSENEEEQREHLKVLLKICKQNGLILSPTKMKIGSPTIEFLGATIGHSKIKLQPHIISKVADFNNQDLQTTKGLRSWLGILNYARSYIPNLGKILGPLYSKVSPNGEKRMNTQDWALVEKVKSMVKSLPDLAIPPANFFVIIESDGCMEGWGGVLKWKPQKFDPKSSELICAYASGKSMEPIRRRYNNPSPFRRNDGSAGEQASYPSLPAPCGPYPLLDQYEELAERIGRSTNTPYEKDKRQHMEDIEDTAARNLLNSLWEFMLIIKAKEKDFARRCQVKRGLHLYFKDALPEVIQTKDVLLDTFIHVQGIVQKIKDTPP
ncbi:hypothetical protein ZIOFF_028272 [Zingiber officinale]|uniref:Reverse transcriptase domain-containing protein n=1 Tax=Zingiber officinale TaxID=94328 RepID=A0A8J5GRT0_ZINOF|nr:hypothetical protein ZIOFF_028272 [Zingiber officinale]